jgi:hypothetical protein
MPKHHGQQLSIIHRINRIAVEGRTERDLHP